MREVVSSLSVARRAKVQEFLEYLVLKGAKPATVECYLEAIRTLGADGKPYEELTREDLVEWMRRLPQMRRDGKNGGRYHPNTVEKLKRLGKSFLLWVHTSGDRSRGVPEVLRAVRYRQPRMDLRKDILSEEEIRKLVDAAERQRDRALIFVGYESGCRAGELLGLRLRDVKLDRYGAVLLVKGKTGTRRVRLVQSVPDLQLWLNMHPLKGNPDAPLWISRQGGSRPITKTRFCEILEVCAKRAGLVKHVHPHLLRHSRATHLASVLTEAQMREFFGWTKRSQVPAVYVHLSGRDVDGTLLKHYGIEVEEAKRSEALEPVDCPRCQARSPPGAKFCLRCGMALSQEAIAVHKEPSEVADELIGLLIRELIKSEPERLERILQSPEVKQRLSELESGESTSCKEAHLSKGTIKRKGREVILEGYEQIKTNR
jgi:integrase/ribosomal protein L40E